MVEQLADAHLLVRLDRRDDDDPGRPRQPRGADWARTDRGTGPTPPPAGSTWASCPARVPSCWLLVLDTATPAVTAALVDDRPPTRCAAGRAVTVDAARPRRAARPGDRGGAGRGRRHGRATWRAVVAGVGPGPVHRAAGRPGHRRRPRRTRSASRRTASARSTRSARGTGRGRPAGRHRRPPQGGLLGRVPRRRPARRARRWTARPTCRRRPASAAAGRRRRPAYADVLGLPVRAEPRYPRRWRWPRWPPTGSARGAPGEPLTPLYLRRPDAVEPGAPKPVLRDRRYRPGCDPTAAGGTSTQLLPIEEDLFGAEQWSAGDVLERAGQRPPLPGRGRAGRRGRRLRRAGAQPRRTRRGCTTSRCAGTAQRPRARPARCWTALLAEAGAARRARTLLEVAADNAPAQRLYAAYGFEADRACARATTSRATPTRW